MNQSELKGRTVLITGAASGIGRAVGHAVVRAGATVILVDRDPIDSSQFPSDAAITSTVVDLSDVSAIDRLSDELASRGVLLDALIHVAGVIIRRSTIEEVTETDFDLQYQVNLRGTFFLVTRMKPRMAKGSSIVLFTSQGWWTGGLGGSLPYAATKAGVVALVRGFARELAPDIRINAVAPGFVDTAMMQNGLTDEQREGLVAQVPLGRMADPVEVADVALFLASEASRYMTGATLNVTGGQLVY